jgi:hypothetical protein
MWLPPPFEGAGAQQTGGIAPYRLGKGVAYATARETDISLHAIIHTGEMSPIGVIGLCAWMGMVTSRRPAPPARARSERRLVASSSAVRAS